MQEVKKVFPVGDALFSEGDVATSLFFIKKGVVSIRKKQGSGELEVAKAIAGQVAGEVSFFNHQPRDETAIAVAYVESMEVSFETLRKDFNLIPDYLKTIMTGMVARLERANEMIQKLQETSGKK